MIRKLQKSPHSTVERPWDVCLVDRKKNSMKLHDVCTCVLTRDGYYERIYNSLSGPFRKWDPNRYIVMDSSVRRNADSYGNGRKCITPQELENLVKGNMYHLGSFT